MPDKPHDQDGPDAPRHPFQAPSPEDTRIWNAIEQLTEREQHFLALSARGYISKEIANLVSDTENAVDQVIKRARAKCGGISRRELVRAYVGWQRSRSSVPGEDQATKAASPDSDHFLVDHISVLAAGNDRGAEETSVHRDDASWRSADGTAQQRGSVSPYISLHVPVGIGGSARNDLSRNSSRLTILVIATVSVMFAIAILTLLSTADQIQIGH